MKFDLRRLRPIDVLRVVNSSSFGAVLTESQLRVHRNQAGIRIGVGRYVDFVKYLAWLLVRRFGEGEEHSSVESRSSRGRGASRSSQDDGSKYRQFREYQAQRRRRLSESGREIGPAQPPKNPERRASCETNFKLFCETYFPSTFHLPWSRDHLKVIAKIEQAVLRGGLFAVAMPRGSGKTTICECACIWAVLYGHREFVVLIGADEAHAESMLTSIKVELETNAMLFDDFNEVVHPIVALDGIANRCPGQLSMGELTHISWRSDEIVLPTMPGSKASGAIIKVAGITGRIRGMKHKTADGRSIRPSLVIIDDPQTDESAKSPAQCAAREAVISGAILNLAGPGRKISGIMPCTVIAPGDLADRLLDRGVHPEWQGERCKLVYAWPRAEEHWRRYAELRATSLRDGNRGEEATEYYRQHRAVMDEGSVVAWPERFNPDELSAIQHAWNLRLRDEAAFFAEYQNEPLRGRSQEPAKLVAGDLAARVVDVPRRMVPAMATRLVCGVDVGMECIWYVMMAFAEDYTGWVVDYGAWPEQGRIRYTSTSLAVRLSDVYPSHSPESQMVLGLRDVLARLRDGWVVRQGTQEPVRLDRVLIDANWPRSSEAVRQFCSLRDFATWVMPSIGRSTQTNALRPIHEWQLRPGERRGWHWKTSMSSGRPYVIFDANEWKTFALARMQTGGGRGSWYVYAGDQHNQFFEHLTSEEPVWYELTEKKVRGAQWVMRNPNNRENHWWDCMVLCYLAASELGLRWETEAVAEQSQQKQPRKTRKYSEIVAEKEWYRDLMRSLR